MKKLLLIAILLFGATTTSFAQQKAKKEVAVSAKKVEKSRGQNPNIKKDFVCDAPDVAVAKPEKSRGGDCTIKVDNWTGYDVKVFVDGYYKGWVAAWQHGYVSVGAGYTTAYCITAGGTLEWSASGDCDFEYVFKLSANNAQ